MKCQACGIEKSPGVVEMCPETGDDYCGEFVPSLRTLDCQDYEYGKGPFKCALVCHKCYHALDPDMWISRFGWEAMSPLVPFEQLPNQPGDDRVPMPQQGEGK